MHSTLRLALLVALVSLSLAVSRAEAQVALPAWMQVRNAQSEETGAVTDPPSSRAAEMNDPNRTKAIRRASWSTAAGVGLITAGALTTWLIRGECRNTPVGDKGTGGAAVPAVIAVGGIGLVVNGAIKLHRLSKQQPLPKKRLTGATIGRSILVAALATGVLFGVALPWTAVACGY